MKKSEISEVEVLSNGKVQYGLDFELLSKAVTPLPEKFKYIVKVYTFTEGRHTYNMTLDEKVLHAQRKRLVGVHWINVIFSFHHLEPLKLQKSPQNLWINQRLLWFRQFFAWRPTQSLPGKLISCNQKHKLSSYLNSTLCYQKLKDWEKLIFVCDKALLISPNNAKIIYRKLYALKEQQEFEKAIQAAETYLSTYGNEISKEEKASITSL